MKCARLAGAALAAIGFIAPLFQACAMTAPAFDQRSDEEKTLFIQTYVLRHVSSIVFPKEKAAQVANYFRVANGGSVPKGVMAVRRILNVRRGDVDYGEIKVERVIDFVIRRDFPPAKRAARPGLVPMSD
jgi:hypothetical protein